MPSELSTYSLPDLARLANASAAQSETYAANAVAKAVEAGSALIEAKAKLEHGKWLGWLDKNWDGTQRWAQSLMKLADAPKAIDVENAGSIKQALKIVDEKVKPEKPSEANSNTNRGAHLEPPEGVVGESSGSIKGEIVEDETDESADEMPLPPSMASIVQDSNGNDVPAELREKFALAAQLKSLGRQVDAVRRESEKLAKNDGGEFVPVQSILLAAKSLKDEITGAAYWSHCPRCGGDGCDRCDHSGFIPRARKGHLSKEDKESLGI